MDQVHQLESQRQAALVQLPLLKQRAHDALMLSQQAQKNYEISQSKFQAVSNRLNLFTLHYIDTVQSVVWGQANLEGEVPELSQMANSASMQDTVLVYSQAKTLMNHMQSQLDQIKTLAVQANQQKQNSETARNNALLTKTAADQAMQQQSQLLEAIRSSQSVIKSNVAADQKALAKTFNQLLDSGADLPGVDVSTTGLPGAQRIVMLALREYQKGVRESPDGSNLSPDISRYLTATSGAVRGAAWCAYFVSYIARRAGLPIGPGGSGMGYVGSVNDWAQSQHRYFSSSDRRYLPQGGDIIMWSPNHIGIVISRQGSSVTTVEGNASNAVSKLRRSISSATGFLRLWGSPIGSNKGGSTNGGTVDLGNIS